MKKFAVLLVAALFLVAGCTTKIELQNDTSDSLDCHLTSNLEVGTDVTIASGQTVALGQALGIVTIGGEWAILQSANSNGTEFIRGFAVEVGIIRFGRNDRCDSCLLHKKVLYGGLLY